MDTAAFIAEIRVKRSARGAARLSRIEARIWAVDAHCRGAALDATAAADFATACRWLGLPADTSLAALRNALEQQIRTIYAE